MQAMKDAEDMTKKKQDRLQRIKQLKSSLSAIQSEIAKHREQKEECLKFKVHTPAQPHADKTLTDSPPQLLPSEECKSVHLFLLTMHLAHECARPSSKSSPHQSGRSRSWRIAASQFDTCDKSQQWAAMCHKKEDPTPPA
eukprot:4398602-Amphidinium_carterae.2